MGFDCQGWRRSGFWFVLLCLSILGLLAGCTLEAGLDPPGEVTAHVTVDMNSGIPVASTSGLPTGPWQGMRAPDFRLVDLDGKEVRLKDLLQKPVLLNFWDPSSAPSLEELPDFETVQKAMGDRITILGISRGSARETVRDFVRQHGYTWRFAVDTEQAVSRQYEVLGVPTSFFINKYGTITARKPGVLNLTELDRLARQAMGLNI